MASYLVFFIPSTLILSIDVYTFFVKSGLNSDTKNGFLTLHFSLFYHFIFPIYSLAYPYF